MPPGANTLSRVASHPVSRLAASAGRLATLTMLGALLTGCAGIPHKPLVQGVTTASPTPPQLNEVNGSIFQTGQAMLPAAV